jgi:uncharacterized protein YciI
MPAQLFFVRLIANRPDFPANLTPEEQATMGAHVAFLKEQLAAGKLVVAGPVLDPAGVFGMGVFEVGSADEVQAILARDPASGIGRYQVSPIASAVYRGGPAGRHG